MGSLRAGADSAATMVPVPSRPLQDHPPVARGGWARAETLFVAGLALVVLSILGPGWMHLRHRQRLAMARSDLRAMIEAGSRYYREYGTWPCRRAPEMGDARFGRSPPYNREVLNVLRSVSGSGNPEYELNEQRMVFLEVEGFRPGWSGLNAEGDFLDPWGQPYEVVLDSDFDNACEVANSIYGRLTGEGMAVWSSGPDRRSDTTDDLCSWKLP